MRKIKIKKNKTEKSKKWLSRHLNDFYYQESKKIGYRSRSAFKLLQINEKYNLFFKGANVLDLGAAPGGWSQIASILTNKHGTIIGIDKLKIKKYDGVFFLQLDIEDDFFEFKLSKFFNKRFDIIMSDMAPNTTGHRDTDHTRITNLAELALDTSRKFLKRGGYFICKLFQGGAQGELLESMKLHIKDIKYFKPEASRKESPEIYLIGKKI